MPKTKASPAPDLAAIAVKLLRARELGRRHYAKSDRLLDSLIIHAKVGEEIALPGGKKCRLKDLYAGQNKVFRAHGIGRFELEVFET